MPGLSYQHIGHDPRHGPVALWSLDETGVVHEDRRDRSDPDPSWIDWSHEKQFGQIKARAVGRVELPSRAGSIHINDPDLLRNQRRLCRVLDALERRFPGTRWFFFGPGVDGATVSQVLSRELAAA